jgi:hypothetical protein
MKIKSLFIVLTFCSLGLFTLAPTHPRSLGELSVVQEERGVKVYRVAAVGLFVCYAAYRILRHVDLQSVFDRLSQAVATEQP